jgi:hypothetical protein
MQDMRRLRVSTDGAAPLWRAAVTRDPRFSGEHHAGLSGDGPRFAALRHGMVEWVTAPG